MMEAEMDDHLGYEKHERSDNDNARNGTKTKRVRSNYGEFEIEVPQYLDVDPFVLIGENQLKISISEKNDVIVNQVRKRWKNYVKIIV